MLDRRGSEKGVALSGIGGKNGGFEGRKGQAGPFFRREANDIQWSTSMARWATPADEKWVAQDTRLAWLEELQF